MLRFLLLSYLCVLASLHGWTQITVSGPMQGHTTDSTTNIWLMVKQKQAPLQFSMKDAPDAEIDAEELCHKRWCTYNLHIEGLQPKDNQLVIANEDNEQRYKFDAINKDTSNAFSFLLGSCTLRWGPLQVIAPGNGYRIFKPMSKHEVDLMLWLGDNVYYLLGDTKNEANMFRENAKSRRKKTMATFIQDKLHYAIWDDHDFGPNNSIGTYENKEIAKKVFNNFWGNPDSPSDGIYYSFEYGHAEFFMLDGRWFRTAQEQPDNALLGAQQLEWLIDGLKQSTAQHKFVVLGSQIINPKGTHHERFAAFKEEYDALLSAVVGLDNVIFISGDMHYSTLFKNDNFGQTLYEFSCSPLTAYRYKVRKKNDEYGNPYFVEGTQYHKQNFGKITIVDDSVLFEVFDKKGKLVYDYQLPQ
ncbi:MAG: alkaline phosphatase D family protein [Chitinophagales bacterium]